MLLLSSVKGTIGHLADGVLLGRDSIYDSNNNNSNNNAGGFNNASEGSLSHIFRCGSKRCQF